MILSPLAPKQSLNKAFRLVKPKRSDMETFKTSLVKMLSRIDERESEENVKKHLMDFLKDAYYRDDFLMAPKGRTDFVVHTGKSAVSPSGVLVETKKPSNRSDMIAKDNLNKKAMHEIILYFLKERVLLKNNAITHIIITNIYEWFIFDANDFERIFTKNTKLVKDFKEWENGQKVSKNTDHFYNEIAAPFLKALDETLDFTHFDIRDFKKYIENNNADDDNALIPLFKILSPVHLLKLPFTNDSNSLDKGFYSELLHIIGLEEVKDGSRKIIQRKAKPDEGSLLENTITILDSEIDLKRVPDIASFGDTRAKQLEAIALELNITWMNRILFLKLLEAQLVKYHKGDRALKFLDYAKIPEYDELNKLFFQVLAKRVDERGGSIAKKFGDIPYLNSSLFEPTALESATIRISGLDDSLELPLFKSSVLKKSQKDSSPTAQSSPLKALNYLLSFLDAYDFASEGSEDIQEESKTLINASVLGLIFEKINGYRDGSIFTPGFITMYMCRESIRAAVVQKMNEHFGWACGSFDDLKNYTADKRGAKDVLELNSIVNSLRVCDPAVGSGHFLVSALNEIIAVKSGLGILADDAGVRLRDIDVNIENDELIIIRDDGNFFSYEISNGMIPREAQRIQKTLFHEKQRIIENCLFGVDINPNSVKICRLRLWIELLKNAYYTEDSGFKHLETLPNIDINIKCGNSLVSRFALDADLKKPLKEIKLSATEYRDAVRNYKNADDKEQKRDFETLINSIKSGLKTEILHNDPKIKELAKLRGELDALNQADMFEPSAKQQKDRAQKSARLEADIEKLLKEIEDVKSNAIYRNAFEWRFEFPEVLDDDGNFKGFDVVVGNPPYMSSKEFDKSLMSLLKAQFVTSEYQLDLYVAFMERGIQVLKPNGIISYITPNSWLKNLTFSECRKYLLHNLAFVEITPNLKDVFQEASVDTLIFIGLKNSKQSQIKINEVLKEQIVLKHIVEQSKFLLNEKFTFNVEVSENSNSIFDKIKYKTVELQSICDITRGVNPYDKYAGHSEEQIKNKVFHAQTKIDESFKPEIRGKHVGSYSYNWDGKHFIKYGNWLAAPRDEKYFTGDRIIMRQVLGKTLYCTLIKEDFIIDQSIFIAKIKEDFKSEYSGEFILAQLASKLMSYYFRHSSNEFDALFPKIKIGEFRQLPIKEIPATEQAPFTTLVEEILAKKQRGEETEELERRIDEMVYVLYGLTAEEIAVVEGK